MGRKLLLLLCKGNSSGSFATPPPPRWVPGYRQGPAGRTSRFYGAAEGAWDTAGVENRDRAEQRQGSAQLLPHTRMRPFIPSGDSGFALGGRGRTWGRGAPIFKYVFVILSGGHFSIASGQRGRERNMDWLPPVRDQELSAPGPEIKPQPRCKP